MEYACVEGVGLDLPLVMKDRNIYCQDGDDLEQFHQLACSRPIQSNFYSPDSDLLGLDLPGALEMSDSSFVKSKMNQAPGAYQLDADLEHIFHPHLGNAVSTGNQPQPDVLMDDNMTTAMSDLWSFCGDSSSHSPWTELCSLSSNDSTNESLSQQQFVAHSTTMMQQHARPPLIATHPTVMLQQQPCLVPHPSVTQQQPPCLVSYPTRTQGEALPCVFPCCTALQHQAESSSSSDKDPSVEFSWVNSEVVKGGLGGLGGLGDLGDLVDLGTPFGDIVAGNHEICPMPVSAINSVDSSPPSSEYNVFNSLVRVPHVFATSDNGGFQSAPSWTSGVPRESGIGSATTVTTPGYQVSIPDAQLSSFGMTANTMLPNTSQGVEDTLLIAPGRMLSSFATPPLSPTSGMPALSESHEPDSLCSIPSVEFTGERLKNFETLFPPGLSKPAAVHPFDGGMAPNVYSEQTPQILRSHRKQNATSIEPQSVAARHRRKRISERVRILESLIPGGSKLDTASMLDESIEYVKFLQLQVHLLESLDASDPECGSSEASSGGGANNLAFPSKLPKGPLIFSEILQQQLFKQKLCLVSLSQVSRGCNSGS